MISLRCSVSECSRSVFRGSLTRNTSLGGVRRVHTEQQSDLKAEEGEAHIDSDSLQGRLIRALQDKYAQGQSSSTSATAASGAGHTAISATRPSSAAATVKPTLGKYEDGRFLPKTPDNQPWNAQYVRPAHAGVFSEEGSSSNWTPSIHYGKFLRAGTGSGSRSTGARLRALGVSHASSSALPLEDNKAMKAIRERLDRFEKAGRMYSARYGASQYKNTKLTKEEIALLEEEIEKEIEHARQRGLEDMLSGQEEGEELRESSNVTRLGRFMPESRDSSRSPGGGGGGGGGSGDATMTLRRWTSIADERIEAARSSGFFKENRLRGKPLEWSIHERNPYLGKEEFLMNRMIKKQGASPPWVELNAELHSDLLGFRSKLIETFTRRAVRYYSRTGQLSSTSLGETTPQRLIRYEQLAKSYRDGEWIATEKAYHEESVKSLNQLLRRYNSISPPSARKGMINREEELLKCFTDSIPFIVQGLEEAYLEVTGQNGRRDPLNQGGFAMNDRMNSFDIWGNPIQHTHDSKSSSSWSSLWTRSRPEDLDKGGNTAGQGGADDDAVRNTGLGDDRRRAQHTGPYLGQGIVEKIKLWITGNSHTQSEQHRQ